MAEAMSDERLARLAADNEPAGDRLSGLTADEVAELVAEAKRARAEAEQLRMERDSKPETRCQALSNTRLRLQCSRPEGHDAAHVAELDGMGRFSWHGDNPQQPEDGDRG